MLRVRDIFAPKAAAKYMGVARQVWFWSLRRFRPLFLNWLFSLPPWAGWAIIGGTMLIGGGIALLVGKRKFDRSNPLPDKTLNAIGRTSWIESPELIERQMEQTRESLTESFLLEQKSGYPPATGLFTIPFTP